MSDDWCASYFRGELRSLWAPPCCCVGDVITSCADLAKQFCRLFTMFISGTPPFYWTTFGYVGSTEYPDCKDVVLICIRYVKITVSLE